MADYEKMYKTLFLATERAIDILIEAQQKCEDLYVDSENDDNLIKFEKNPIKLKK